MNPIRPGLPPQVQPSSPPRTSDSARAAAQRAFFEIATGKAPAPAAQPAVQAAAPVASPATPSIREAAAPQSAAPARLPRPGSFLDIKV